MSRLKAFLREKGFYFALLACIALATAASIWAIRTMVSRMSRQNSEILQQQPGQSSWEQMPGLPAEAPKADVPVATPGPTAQAEKAPVLREPPALRTQTDPTPAPTEAPAAAASAAWPVQGGLMRPFSGDELVYSTTLKDWRTHNGADIACAAGSAVCAAWGGTVTAVEETGLWGTVVEVTGSDGLVWRYCGLAAGQTPAKDSAVSAGDVLGKLGTVECELADEPHLHLEVLQNGEPINPVPLFG